MPARPPLKAGDVFWLADCPSLDGGPSKRRPVVLIDSQHAIDDGADPLLIVALTTAHITDHDRVALPNQTDTQGTSTGLPEPCCAVPRWTLLAHRDQLTDRAGRVPLATLMQIQEAVDERADDPADQ